MCCKLAVDSLNLVLCFSPSICNLAKIPYMASGFFLCTGLVVLKWPQKPSTSLLIEATGAIEMEIARVLSECK